MKNQNNNQQLEENLLSIWNFEKQLEELVKEEKEVTNDLKNAVAAYVEKLDAIKFPNK